MVMVPPLPKKDTAQHGRKDSGIHRPGKENGRTSPVKKAKENEAPARRKEEDDGLKDYQLSDLLGKGAFGSVYKAFNWGTGKTVAIKQVKLGDLPKSELRVIMAEIDLLKNLNHPNIVKYHGSSANGDMLSIILEYCENGSLHSICKDYGKFPEGLVALYMSQVLQGLLYLHDQGVIHRDIKGANILTTKDGIVKLADFGVATRTAGLHESSVVGTPYWMAPEVIELSGATTASDIWSLGCTVIELLDGRPPYYKLQPMPALFRIVNDDHPPLPESASPAVIDFLMQCFQKDPNLRISAKKLLRHPWIVSAKRADAVVPVKPTKYDEAVKTVQEWNEALKSPEGTLRRQPGAGSTSPFPDRSNALPKLVTSLPVPKASAAPGELQRAAPLVYPSPDDLDNNVWDDDFASSIHSGLQLPAHLKPVDNFAGALSSEKLKAYATTDEGNTIKLNGKSSGISGEARGSTTLANADPLETVRAPSPIKAKRPQHSQKQERPASRTQRVTSQPKTQILRGQPKPASAPSQTAAKRPLQPKRSSSIFREEPDGDYADLIVEDEDAFDQKVNQIRDATSAQPFSPTFPHMSDLKTVPRSTKLSKANSSSIRSKRVGSSDTNDIMQNGESPLEIQKYAEKPEDQDFSELFGAADEGALVHPNSDGSSEPATLSMLNSKISSGSWLGDEEEEEDDPFAELEENLDSMDLETKVARDKHVRLCTLVEGLVGSLKMSQSEEYLTDLSDQLMQVLFESPDMRTVVISSHGLLPILEILESCQRTEVSLRLLKIINIIILDSVEVQETLCFVGGIPTVTRFAHKKYSSEIRLEAAAFVRQMYQTSTLTLQMFISCGGLNVLVEFLEEDYDAEPDLVIVGVNGVWSVFELQGPTPKNDFCRIFSRSSALYPLSLVLNRVLDEEGELAELIEGRIANIFFIFSQAENHVKESVADRMILKKVLRDLKRMSPPHQITMLKFVKNLSMLATTLDALQNSNCIEELSDLLAASMKLPTGKRKREMWNHISNIMFNLCRLSKTRQEDAALNGVIPLLQKIAEVHKPIKNFALPVLCDMAHSGRVCRRILWQHKGLAYYIGLLEDTYWGAAALDAIFIWLQEETAKVEDHLLDGSFSAAIVSCFAHAEKDAFENLLEPLQKLLRLSPPVAAQLSHPQLFSRAVIKLNNKKPQVRLNLLRIIRNICDSSEEQGSLIRQYSLYDAIDRLAEHDPAILVRNLAADLIRISELSDRPTIDVARFPGARRTSSSTMTPPPPLYNTSSQPPTPQRSSAHSSSYFDLSLDAHHVYHQSPRPRPSNMNNVHPYRPVSREGPGMNHSPFTPSKLVTSSDSHRMPPPSSNNASSPTIASSTAKSRLPHRTAPAPPTSISTRASRSSTASSSSSFAGSNVTTSTARPTSRLQVKEREKEKERGQMVTNPRRRRQTSAGGAP